MVAAETAHGSRPANWDPQEVPSVVRYADRNGLHPEVVEILVEHLGTLAAEERTWLSQAWPAVASGTVPIGDIPPPDRDRLSEPIFEEHRTNIDDTKLETMWDECVREAWHVRSGAPAAAEGIAGEVPGASGSRHVSETGMRLLGPIVKAPA